MEHNSDSIPRLWSNRRSRNVITPMMKCSNGDENVLALFFSRSQSPRRHISCSSKACEGSYSHLRRSFTHQEFQRPIGTFRFAQAGIRPGENYTYRFVAYPPGTHWWHAHMDALQVCYRAACCCLPASCCFLQENFSPRETSSSESDFRCSERNDNVQD